MGSGAKPQPTKDLVHIQGQNNRTRSNIFVGFAEEIIEHFAKLKQKEAKDTLERENIDFQPQNVGGQRLCPQGLKSGQAAPIGSAAYGTDKINLLHCYIDEWRLLVFLFYST